MSRYFDKKFWKMLSGFIAIIAVSAIIIFSAKLHEKEKQSTETSQANVIIISHHI
jgi:hypothetical protein